jgi:hypothetical protein
MGGVYLNWRFAQKGSLLEELSWRVIRVAIVADERSCGGGGGHGGSHGAPAHAQDSGEFSLASAAAALQPCARVVPRRAVQSLQRSLCKLQRMSWSLLETQKHLVSFIHSSPKTHPKTQKQGKSFTSSTSAQLLQQVPCSSCHTCHRYTLFQQMQLSHMIV